MSNQLISLKVDAMIWLTNVKNRSTFNGDLFLDAHSRSLFHFPTIAEYGILADLLAFIIAVTSRFS